MKIVDDTLRTESLVVSKYSVLVEPLKEGKTLQVDATDGVKTTGDISNLRMLMRGRGFRLHARRDISGTYYIVWCDPIPAKPAEKSA